MINEIVKHYYGEKEMNNIGMSETRGKYLFKNTAIFTLGNIATKLISFFLLPLYTNILSTSEYGIIDLVVTVCTLVVPILTLNVMEAVMRFNLDEGADRERITKSGMLVILGGIVVGLVLLPISSLFSLLTDIKIYVYLYCITSALSQFLLCDLRGKELLVYYSVGNVLNTLCIAFFNIIFLVYLKIGIKGYFLAYIIANSIVSIYAFIAGKTYKAFNSKVDYCVLKEMLKYSIVLIPNSFMWWIMNSSDHIMVTSMIGAAANGVYAISYKFPTLITVIVGIFNQAWSYSAIKEKDSEDVEIYTNKVFKDMIGVVMLVGLGMMTFIKPFLRVYVSKEYFEAWKYTPFLIIGCVFMTLGTFMSTSYTAHKDSKGFLASASVGAVLNILLNFILIPHWGVYGAAFATCISYIAVFTFRVFNTRKYIRYHVLVRAFFVGSFSLVFSAFLMYFDSIIFQIVQILLFLFVLALLKDYWISLFGNLIKRKSK